MSTKEKEIALKKFFERHLEVLSNLVANVQMFSTPTETYVLTGEPKTLTKDLISLYRTIEEIVQQLDKNGSCIIQVKEPPPCRENLFQQKQEKAGK